VHPQFSAPACPLLHQLHSTQMPASVSCSLTAFLSTEPTFPADLNNTL
jgi:hypothetical protein